MRIRGTRRRKSVDKGFGTSDHADWDALNEVVRATGAERILVTHGYSSEMVRWLKELGLDAATLATRFEGELGEMQPEAGSDLDAATEAHAARNSDGDSDTTAPEAEPRYSAALKTEPGHASINHDETAAPEGQPR